MSLRNRATWALRVASVSAFFSLASACWRNRACSHSARVARTASHVLTTTPAASSKTNAAATASPALCRRTNFCARYSVLGAAAETGSCLR